jgi:hypothetical protein
MPQAVQRSNGVPRDAGGSERLLRLVSGAPVCREPSRTLVSESLIPELEPNAEWIARTDRPPILGRGPVMSRAGLGES